MKINEISKRWRNEMAWHQRNEENMAMAKCNRSGAKWNRNEIISIMAGENGNNRKSKIIAKMAQ
jgi:hypothetical protein